MNALKQNCHNCGYSETSAVKKKRKEKQFKADTRLYKIERKSNYRQTQNKYSTINTINGILKQHFFCLVVPVPSCSFSCYVLWTVVCLSFCLSFRLIYYSSTGLSIFEYPPLFFYRFLIN